MTTRTVLSYPYTSPLTPDATRAWNRRSLLKTSILFSLGNFPFRAPFPHQLSMRLALLHSRRPGGSGVYDSGACANKVLKITHKGVFIDSFAQWLEPGNAHSSHPSRSTPFSAALCIASAQPISHDFIGTQISRLLTQYCEGIASHLPSEAADEMQRADTIWLKY